MGSAVSTSGTKKIEKEEKEMCVTELNIRISNICRNWCIINLLILPRTQRLLKGYVSHSVDPSAGPVDIKLHIDGSGLELKVSPSF